MGPKRKEGGRSYTNNIKTREFYDFVVRNGLVDFDFTEPRFTWRNNHQGNARVWEQIGRAFITTYGIQDFLRHQMHYLPRIAYDDCPVLISIDVEIFYWSFFCFEKF